MIVKLLIELNTQTRGVNVTGPINDVFLCHGMLGMAMDAIRANARKLEEEQRNGPRIEVPDIRLEGFDGRNEGDPR